MQTTRIRLKTETPMIYLIIKLFTNALPWHKNFSCLVWSVSSDSSVKCWSKMHRISIWRHSVHRNISRKCCCKDGDFFLFFFFLSLLRICWVMISIAHQAPFTHHTSSLPRCNHKVMSLANQIYSQPPSLLSAIPGTWLHTEGKAPNTGQEMKGPHLHFRRYKELTNI